MDHAKQSITEELQHKDRKHHMHPFTDMQDINRRGTRVISKAEGVYVWDSDGNRLLDGMSGLWCVNVGYGREELARVAYEQMKVLPYYNSFFQCTTEPTIELAEKIASVAPAHINTVFFTSSGSEANDTVVRLARYYWALRDQPDKTVIISRKNAYHGSTVAAASLGGMTPMHKQGGLPIPDIEHIDEPYWFGEGGDEERNAFGLRIAAQLEEKILALGVDRVAAFIGEPIQGAGGVVIPPDSYWPEIQRICDRYGILLVADEVICGFGRTGRWFGADYYGLTPDMMPIAKGLTSGYLPMGGVMISDRVAGVLAKKGGEIAHGYTYSGHPVAAAVGLRNLEIIEREGLVDKIATETGPYLQTCWQELADHPLVGETRGVGFLAAVELVQDKTSRRGFAKKGRAGEICRDASIANGLIMRAKAETMIVAPPLVCEKSHIDELVDKVRKSLDDTLAAIRGGAIEAA